MGNESSCHTNYRLCQRVETSSNSSDYWNIYDSVDKDGAECSVFVYSLADPDHSIYVDNAARHLRTLRHPNVLKYINLAHTTDEAWLITERVKPLDVVVDKLTANEICAGLSDVIRGLAFLHDQVGISHNNFNTASVFVGTDGAWKIGDMGCACKHSEATATYLRRLSSVRHKGAIPPEEEAGSLPATPNPKAADVYALGRFADCLLDQMDLLGNEMSVFRSRIQDECLNADPLRRPTISSLVNEDFFKNDFTKILNFLKLITLKSDSEKRQFFVSLPEQLQQLPVEVVATRLVRPLLSRFVLLEDAANQHFLPHFLTPQTDQESPEHLSPILPESLFREHVIPELFKIFHVHDVQVRTVLLDNFHRYVNHFDEQVLADVILPQVLLGIRDIDDTLVMLSLRALSDIVAILGGDVVLGTDRIRLFTHGTPKNRLKNAQVITGTRNKQRLNDINSSQSKRSRQKEVARLSKTSTPTSIDKTTAPNSSLENEDDLHHTSRRVAQPQPNDSVKADDVIAVQGQSKTNKSQPVMSRPLKLLANSTQKESSASTASDPVPDRTTDLPVVVDGLDDWNEAPWEDMESTSYSHQSTSDVANANPQNAAPRSQQLPSSRSNSTANSRQSGKDVNIMTLDIKTMPSSVVSNEVDFFADMAPTIKPSASDLLHVLSADMSTARQTVNKLALTDTVNTDDVSGWGDELDMTLSDHELAS